MTTHSRDDAKLAKILEMKIRKLNKNGYISVSKSKNKRFTYTTETGKKIHFGDPNAVTFIDGADENKRKSYRARASKIKNKQGQYTYEVYPTANWMAYNLLW